MKLIWFLAILSAHGLSSAERILMAVFAPSVSHNNLMEKLAVDLVQKGHHVTLITPFPRTTPVKNLEEIVYPNYYNTVIKSFTGGSPNILDWQMNPLVEMIAIQHVGLVMTETFLSTPVIQQFLRSQRKYDVVIGEAFFAEAALAGFVSKFNAPLIGLEPTLPNICSNHMVGNPAPTSYIPTFGIGLSESKTFSQRFVNFWVGTFLWAYFHGAYLPKQGSIFEKHFGLPSTSMKSIITNTSLVLVNHHNSLSQPRPYVPNMIEIGGYHVRPVKPLPDELKNYLDQSKQGVILFSMGSHLKSASLPKEKLLLFLKVFSRLKQNVLWKFEDDNLSDIPKNVKIMKWLPQSDILAHPNIKLFITHGGLLSNIEAVLRGVPLLGLPVMGDQPTNMILAERAGYGKMLTFKTLTEENFYNTITEMLTNPTYRDNIKRRSLTLKDTPLPAADTAVYWVEYVIRHKGGPHLRSRSLDLYWFQLYQTDVILVSLAFLFCFCAITGKICRAVFCRKSAESPKKKSD